MVHAHSVPGSKRKTTVMQEALQFKFRRPSGPALGVARARWRSVNELWTAAEGLCERQPAGVVCAAAERETAEVPLETQGQSARDGWRPGLPRDKAKATPWVKGACGDRALQVQMQAAPHGGTLGQAEARA